MLIIFYQVLLEHCTEVNKIGTKILKGSIVAVTQTVLGELTINSPVANFLWCMSAKIMKVGWQ